MSPSNDRESHESLQDLIRLPALLLTALIIGYLLTIGQNFLLPILWGAILVLIVTHTAKAMGRAPVIGKAPSMVRHGLVLFLFVAFVFMLVVVIGDTADQIIAAAPTYQTNLQNLFSALSEKLGLQTDELWRRLEKLVDNRVDLEALAASGFQSITNIGALFAMIFIYAAFLMLERPTFAPKLAKAFAKPENAERARIVIQQINDRIGAYLTAKTLINVILGVISYAILRYYGIDFALFWAVIIAILNYIPYIGSLVSVLLPVLLSMAQFGDVAITLTLAALLVAAQLVVANFIEPPLVGRRVNLSSFVVIAALAFWTALWGLAGTILAIPLTSIIAIVTGAFEGTRWIAVLLSQDGEVSMPPAAAASEA